ncbi:MAG TPA: hypothetical protein PLO61_06265 [Fimbriimonadaceae bacterium]|nr:hypothetical protein [Fimbriimonadaceae bacterium]HRJ33145.1 hypothetical protein [Fimbriimonadaceae bacterium]
MTILIFERNLIWSGRLVRSARALGHEPIVLAAWPDQLPSADFAILNLGEPPGDLTTVVEALHAAGISTIGHAGHKEKGPLAYGVESGCDQVVSNSSLTFKLNELLDPAKLRDMHGPKLNC